ncbi:hypothetical protein [Heyndrickxia sporothermodurans]|uniref:hypothetical protein n=1 Tax=Heyndrickxia sporothermodurans TaxID=46224 RepID=UPI000D3BBF82|nr:hypothetical protein [Heyndrickxia sporothermodurans]PTY92951.1 hypothetical protein B5V90_02405 [Heyndrickxia sporothermodurans]
MDVKITNGYILPPMSLTELNSFVQEYRKTIRVMSKQLVIERLGNMCMGYIDFVSLPEDKRTYFVEMNRQIFLPKDGLKHSPLFTAYSKMQEMEQRIVTEKIRKPEYDFLCDLILFPSDDHILAMLFAEQKAYVDAFEKMPGVRSYSYWDTEEQPEDISKKAWKQRAKHWQEAVGYTGIPSLEGFNVSCYNQLPFVDPNDIHRYIEERFNLDIRVNNYASKIVILRKYQDLIGQDKLWGTEEMYKQATLYLKTPEGTAEYQQESKLLKTLFKPEITSDDLATSFSVLIENQHE